MSFTTPLYPNGQPPRKRKSLVGRILKGVGLGLLDSFPVVAQIVNTVNADKVVNEVSKPARAVTGLTSLIAIILLAYQAWVPGADKATILQLLMQVLGLP
jgi:hypothetical protein